MTEHKHKGKTAARNNTRTNETKLAHHNHIITVDCLGRFIVEEIVTRYETYKEACAAVDRLVIAERTAMKSKMSLAIIDEYGVKRTITGVHAGNFHMLIEPKPDRFSALYPDTPSVCRLVEKLVEQRAQVKEIESELSKLELLYNSWTQAHVNNIGKSYATIKREYTIKAAKAEASKP